jgi:hypothetical protein
MVMQAVIPWGWPAAWWWLLIALPVIAAFFFRYRSRVQEIPALTYWLSLGRPLEVRSTSTLLRRLFSLAWQLAIVALLVFALADPFPQSPEANRVAIVIDTSATMQTREAGGSRLDLAIAQAQHILANQNRNAKVFLITASNHPASVKPSALKVAEAQSLLHHIHASDTANDLPAAIRAVSFLSSDADAKAFVISDFAGTSPPSVLAKLWKGVAPLELIPVGTNHADLAITALWTQPEANGLRIDADFASHGLAGKTLPARLISDGKILAEQPVRLTDTPGRVEFHADLPPDTPYKIEIQSGDSLSVDDVAFGVPPSQPIICLVTRGDPPLEDAIRANEAAQIRIVPPEEYTNPGDANVVIFDDCRPMRVQGQQPKGYLFINTPDPFGFATTNGELQISHATHWQGDHPALAEVDPTDIQFRMVLSLQATGPGRLVPILSAGNVPLIAEWQSSQSNQPRMIYWPFRLDDTDLPHRMIFPILLWNTLDYLGGSTSDAATHITGSPVTVQSAATPKVFDPAGKPIALRRFGDGFSISDTSEQGIYAVQSPDGDKKMAINLFSATGTLPLPRDSAGTVIAAGSTNAIQSPRLNWRTLLIACLAFAATEWLLFHLRLIRIG